MAFCFEIEGLFCISELLSAVYGWLFDALYLSRASDIRGQEKGPLDPSEPFSVWRVLPSTLASFD